MQINELTDLGCEACSEAVDLTADGFEPVLPLLCDRCLRQLVEHEAERELAVAA